MSIAETIIALQFGSPKMEDIRRAAVKGDPGALLKYVYFCAWQGIRSDKFIPTKKKAAVFRQLVESEMITVALAPPDEPKINPYKAEAA